MVKKKRMSMQELQSCYGDNEWIETVICWNLKKQ